MIGKLSKVSELPAQKKTAKNKMKDRKMISRVSNTLSKIKRFIKERFNAKNPYGKQITVGIMRPDIVPPALVTTIAMMAPQYHVKVIYFNPKGVNIKRGMVSGQVLSGSKWVKYHAPIPRVIDASPYCFKKANERVIEYLASRSFLTDDRQNRITKRTLPNLLSKSPEFAKYAIKTRRFSSASALIEFVRKHGECVVKPIYSQRGTGVYRISFLDEDKVSVGFKTTLEIMSIQEFEAFTEAHFLKRAHIVQEYVSSRSVAGDPFDCRVHVEKDGTDTWQVARMFIRIGIGQQVISNVNQGGGIADPIPFLKANRPDKWEQILASLNHFAQTFPYYYEALRGRRLMQLGIDVGIDEEGFLHVFECNSSPAADSHKAEVAMLRLPHYRYLYEHAVKNNEPFVERRPWENE